MTAKPKTGGDGSTDPGREAWLLLYQLIQEDRDALASIAQELDLSGAQLNLLRHLPRGVTATMVSLAKVLRCDDSNVTFLVDKLEERGLIRRQADPSDRRVRRVALTPAGEHLRARLMDRLAVPLPFIQRMSSADKRALRDIMRRAIKKSEVAPIASSTPSG